MLAGRYKGIAVIAVLIAAAMTWAWWPRPVLVEFAAVARRPLEVAVEEEGRTRVKDRYVLYAPVAGYLRRVTLEPGDAVAAGEAVAWLDPLPAATLDPRARAEAEARLAAMRAALEQARERRKQAVAEAQLAEHEFARRQELLAQQLISRTEFDQAESRRDAAVAAAAAASSAVEVARHEVEAAEAVLSYAGAMAGDEAPAPIALRAPVDGRVLKRLQESAGVVAAGQPLVEVGDTRALEVEVEVLSRDAVRIEPGGRVLFERWGGGESLQGRVRVVEPAGFTKISALGVEEQRVLVIADLLDPPEAWQRLGDGYRVEARFITWADEDALTAPASALFRRGDAWEAFVAEDGRARRVSVTPGRSSGLVTEIVAGLEAGQRVIVHPPEEVEDGVRVAPYEK
jgi:HlyD family secretion protein